MSENEWTGATAGLDFALHAPTASARLQAAMAAGMQPRPDDVEVLISRCAVEPDFFVRDMLSWALMMHDPASTLDRLMLEVGSAIPQARSQALHTLSKIGDPRAWPAITPELLTDPDDGVARAAWRCAVVLVPRELRADLARRLATQFARGDREVQLSLSRAFADLGDPASPVVEEAMSRPDPAVRAHALATARIMRNPEEGFDDALAAARRIVALGTPPAE